MLLTHRYIYFPHGCKNCERGPIDMHYFGVAKDWNVQNVASVFFVTCILTSKNLVTILVDRSYNLLSNWYMYAPGDYFKIKFRNIFLKQEYFEYSLSTCAINSGLTVLSL